MWQSVLPIPGPDVVDVTPFWPRVDATCTGESLHIVIWPKVPKNTKEVTGSFPIFCHFPRKAVRMPICVGMLSPRLCCQSLNKELKFRSGTRDFY